MIQAREKLLLLGYWLIVEMRLPAPDPMRGLIFERLGLRAGRRATPSPVLLSGTSPGIDRLCLEQEIIRPGLFQKFEYQDIFMTVYCVAAVSVVCLEPPPAHVTYQGDRYPNR